MCIDWFYWIKWKKKFSPRLASNCWAFIENISYKKSMCNWYLVRTCVWMNQWMFGFYSITKHTERVIDIFRQYVGEMKSYVMQNIMDSLASPAIVDGLEFIETWNTPIESNRIESFLHILFHVVVILVGSAFFLFLSHSSSSLLQNLYSSCILRATCEIHFICFSDYKLIIAFEPSNLVGMLRKVWC